MYFYTRIISLKSLSLLDYPPHAGQHRSVAALLALLTHELLESLAGAYFSQNLLRVYFAVTALSSLSLGDIL